MLDADMQARRPRVASIDGSHPIMRAYDLSASQRPRRVRHGLRARARDRSDMRRPRRIGPDTMTMTTTMLTIARPQRVVHPYRPYRPYTIAMVQPRSGTRTGKTSEPSRTRVTCTSTCTLTDLACTVIDSKRHHFSIQGWVHPPCSTRDGK
jgi:hypothetical protein